MRRTASGRFGRMQRGERGAALVVAVLVLAILTIIGIALMLITSTESRIAANEWSVNRAFYSADAGIRWAAIQMAQPAPFMTRNEFVVDFGTVLFQMPSHRFDASVTTGFLTGFGGADEINVRVQQPSLLGRRFFPGGSIGEVANKAQYLYAYEVRSNAGQRDDLANPIPEYSKALVADVEVGPLPAKLPF